MGLQTLEVSFLVELSHQQSRVLVRSGARCDNLALQHQKANGSLLGADSVRLWLWPQVLTQLHKCLRKGTQGISLEKFTKVHHGNYICPWGV